MDFEKKFLHPTKSNETILIKWSKGYREVQVWFHNEHIKTINDPKTLISGIIFQNAKLGSVKILLSEKPKLLNLLVNNIHSKTNQLHPSKRINGVGNWFIIPAVISTVALISLFISHYNYIFSLRLQVYLLLIILFLITGLLISTIILCRAKKYIPFLISYALVVFTGLVLLYPTITDFHIGYLLLIVPFLIYIAGMTLALHRVILFMKHKRIQEDLNESILDN